VIFSLDGLGLLGFEATINRDFPLMLGSLFFFSLLGLTANLLGDICYVLVDPRIDFAGRDV
jgi:microcin C transport system permease protein